MSRAVLLSSRAQKEFEFLDSRHRERVRSALAKFAATGRGDLKRLKSVQGGADLFRLRVGDARIVFEQTSKEIRITRIVRRGDGYSWL